MASAWICFGDPWREKLKKKKKVFLKFIKSNHKYLNRQNQKIHCQEYLIQSQKTYVPPKKREKNFVHAQSYTTVFHHVSEVFIILSQAFTVVHGYVHKEQFINMQSHSQIAH